MNFRKRLAPVGPEVEHISVLEINTCSTLSPFVPRSNNRHQSLQEALDRLLLFHKNMISALTWLSSAESKVAELDSLVEASQTEEAADMDELQREMMVRYLLDLF